eukprot:TRINITY_DN56343_c0_g1_i1.p1 TRINITY_DN56343_c0_g1~~TRINITY_DN56343_c0_g1_i1.p1  ORF type:complete len:495 (-),score=48.10 TRINITY_DN56343_c0_g1_i1:406-1890(-)
MSKDSECLHTHQRALASAFQEMLAEFRQVPQATWTDSFVDSLPIERASVKAFWEDFFSPEHVPILEKGICCTESRLLLSRHLRQEGDDRHSVVPTKADLESRVRRVAAKLPAAVIDAICRNGGVEDREGVPFAVHITSSLLPLVTYSSNTIYMVEFFRRMRELHELRLPTAESMRTHLGPFAGFACGLAQTSQVIRDAVVGNGLPEKGMTDFFMDSREQRKVIPNGLAARALWAPDFTSSKAQADWLYGSHTNFTSFSLSVDGALSVLFHYQDKVKAGYDPLILVAPRCQLLALGLAMGAFYSVACGLDADIGTPICEEEIMLPPFPTMTPVWIDPRSAPAWWRSCAGTDLEGMNCMVPVASIEEDEVVTRVGEAWLIPKHELRPLLADLRRILDAAGYGQCAECRCNLRPVNSAEGLQQKKCINCSTVVTAGTAPSWRKEAMPHTKVVFLRSIEAAWFSSDAGKICSDSGLEGDRSGVAACSKRRSKRRKFVG